jgi:CDP-ribitol ribitolphosphotransferase / teichoic acid ribitol-phosphate polymerase
MKAVFFCTNPYSFGILRPLYDEWVQQGHEALWFVRDRHLGAFPFGEETTPTDSIKHVMEFEPDALFVPGNQVPHYVPGVKVQVFHGFAGEKKGHFRIRHYFDLYCTQGPYFTERFQALAKKHRDFEIVETGWCKLDPLYAGAGHWHEKRQGLLGASGKKKIILFAPTFSPSLTCAAGALEPLKALAQHPDLLVLVKFHDLMDSQWVSKYNAAAALTPGLEVVDDRNILPYLAMADLMVSDTSSAVYEFLLLDKPVVTVNSTAPKVYWRNISHSGELQQAVEEELVTDSFADARQQVNAAYHPYTDGKSSQRMIAAVKDYIARNGVPEQRKLSWLRRWRMHKYFGKNPIK